MNFITQLGVLAVILIILMIIIKSNQTLEEIYMEDREEKPSRGWPFGKKEKGAKLFSKTEPEQIEQAESAQTGKAESEQIRKAETSAIEQQPHRSQPTVPVEQTQTVKLKIEILDERGRVLETKNVSSFPFTIGRNEENDLELDDLSVSGYHAILEEEDGIPMLTDCGSLNKLMVHGRVEKRVAIGSDMEVGLGNTTLRFVCSTGRASQTLYYDGSSLMEEWH
jgi:pSer/pThr/pTyr-binding forkhead associated (FHA) protein